MQKTRITGTQGKEAKEIEAHVHAFETSRGSHAGLIILQERFLKFNPEAHPFLNDTFGTAMNQNVSFGGVPELIDDGAAGGWGTTAIQGIWNFTDAGKTSLTSANNNDEALFEDGTTTDMAGFTTLTGLINLTVYNAINNSLNINFANAGTPVGNSVDINDYIDTGLLGTEQPFVIPKADLGLTTQIVDDFHIILTRIGGAKPTMAFDDIQWEQTGTSAIFKATTPPATKFYTDELRISIADNITGITTVAGATETATVPNLAYDALLGVTALTNGINFQRVHKELVTFSANLKQLSDFLEFGLDITNHISDGTNTFITLSIKFAEPIILNGGENDFFSFTINDDLSNLLQFSAIARGSIEV